MRLDDLRIVMGALRWNTDQISATVLAGLRMGRSVDEQRPRAWTLKI